MNKNENKQFDWNEALANFESSCEIFLNKIKEIVKKYCRNLSEIADDIYQSVCVSLIEKKMIAYWLDLRESSEVTGQMIKNWCVWRIFDEIRKHTKYKHKVGQFRQFEDENTGDTREFEVSQEYSLIESNLLLNPLENITNNDLRKKADEAISEAFDSLCSKGKFQTIEISIIQNYAKFMGSLTREQLSKLLKVDIKTIDNRIIKIKNLFEKEFKLNNSLNFVLDFLNKK